MNSEQLLLDKWRDLTADKQQEVLDFLEFIHQKSQQKTTPQPQWQYLEKRPHPWRQQLYIKGKKLRASTVWMDMIVNNLTSEEVAENKEIPLVAVHEALKYCETHQELLQQEALIERRQLEEKGISLEPKIIH